MGSGFGGEYENQDENDSAIALSLSLPLSRSLSLSLSLSPALSRGRHKPLTRDLVKVRHWCLGWLRVGVERTLHDLAQAQTTKNTHSNVHCFQQVGSFTIPQTLCTYCSFPKTGASCRKWVGGWTFMYAIVSQSACACVYARMHRISHVMYNVHMYASMILSIYLSVSFSSLSLYIYRFGGSSFSA